MLEPQILSSSKMLLWQLGRRAGTGSFTFVGSTTALPLPLPGQNMLCQEKMQYMHQLLCTNFYAPTIYAPTSMHQLYAPTSLQASKIRNYYPPAEWVSHRGRYTGEILAHLKTQRVPQNSCCVSSCPEKPNMYTIYLIYFYIFMWHILHLYVFIATSICPECALSCIDLH